MDVVNNCVRKWQRRRGGSFSGIMRFLSLIFKGGIPQPWVPLLMKSRRTGSLWIPVQVIKHNIFDIKKIQTCSHLCIRFFLKHVDDPIAIKYKSPLQVPDWV